MRLRLLEGFDRQIRDFVASRSPMGVCRFAEGDRGFAVVFGDDNRLAAGVVFSNWVPAFASVELSAAVAHSHALSPQIVAALGGYAFGQLQANRVWARTSIKNHRAIRLLKHIGFTGEAVHADFYGVGRHAETYRMLRREWDARYGTFPVKQEAA
jgi:RimJ/RimL family protein N-acetyltransferase